MKINIMMNSRIIRRFVLLIVLPVITILSACNKEDDPVPEGEGELASLQQFIAGGRIVVYSRTSYVNSNTASSLAYYNFCANGNFYISSDASFSVGGTNGASQSSQYGTWQVIEHQNTPTVEFTFANGNVNYSAINEQTLRAGSWRQGNTEYAFEQGRAVCQ